MFERETATGATAVSIDACSGYQGVSVTFREAFWVWVKVALNSFGGPTGQIAVMHRYLVEEKRVTNPYGGDEHE
jgi:chromate transporter